MYLKANSQGGYDDGGGADGICTFIVPSFVSKGMAAWFKSSEWEDVIRYDKMLYESANQSLDLTIDMLGRENVQQNVERFRQIQKSALEHCLKEAIFPCNSRGERVNTTNCLWIDSGCGTQCLDHLSTKIESRNTTRRS